MFDALEKEDFKKIRRRCLENLNVACGMSLSQDVKDDISKAQDLDDLFEATCSSRNWMNIRVIEKMAGKCEKAKKLIGEYKDNVYSRKVKEVVSEIPDLEVPADKFTEVKEKWDMEFDDLKIKDLVKRWNEIEKILEAEGSMLFNKITVGCVNICWLIPNDLVEHAVHLATKSLPVKHDDHDQSATENQEFYSKSLSLEIGDKVIIEDTITSKSLLRYNVN